MKLESVDENWEAFKSGHRESFGTIYQYYKPLLLFFCLGKVKNKELAESLASEALIKTFTLEKPAEIKNLEQWLFTVARNLCISHLRTVKRQHEILTEIYADKKVGHKPEVEGKQAQESIDQIIKLELNKEEYLLWQLHSQGFDNEEISVKVGMNPKTVANKKSVIRGRLKRLFNKYRY
ncbi:MAG: sigma-70 family RNA polymerase sigma factor [Bacteroidota bacterium]